MNTEKGKAFYTKLIVKLAYKERRKQKRIRHAHILVISRKYRMPLKS